MSYREVVLTWAQRLYEAVERVDIYTVKDLVHRKGANSDIVLAEYGISAFHLAVGIKPISFSKEVTALFLVCGGNPNVRSSEGLTPVHVASIWGRAENLKLLLLAGGDPRLLDDDGRSSLDYAKEKLHLSCIDVINQYGRAFGFHSPTYGLLNVIGNHMDNRKRESLPGLIARKSFDKHVKLWDEPGCRYSLDSLLSNAQQNEKSYGGCLFGPERNSQVMQDIIVEENNLISEAEKSEDSVQIIEGVVKSPEGVVKSKKYYRAPDETYSIHGSPEARHLNYHRSVDDYMTQDDSENGSDAASRDHNDDMVVRNITRTLSVQDSPNNIWSNSIVTNDASVERRCFPVGNNHDNSYENRVPTANLSYVNFLLSAESSRSSTPLQRRLSKPPRCHLEENTVVQRRKKIDLSSDTSSILSISCPEIYQKCFEEELKNVTSRRKLCGVNHMDSKVFTVSRSESEEYFTVPEEVCEITDEEEGVILKERRLETPVLAGRVVYGQTEEGLPWKGEIYRTGSSSSLASGCTEDIRRELYKVVSCGCPCPVGPITATTKRVYLRMIKKFKLANAHLMDSQCLLPPAKSDPLFSRELEETLNNPSKLSHGKYFELEQKMMMQFDGSGKFSQWRDGNQKSSFNYLLLDPRMTLNLPLRWANDTTLDKSFYSNGSSQYWREFLNSIFYIGKGKRSRPYSHLYEAVNAWRNKCSDVVKLKKKVRHIIEIWKEDMGVVCVHLFQNVIPAEALTREAAMIDAIGLRKLTNEQRGKYYGLISTLGFSEKRYFGSFLLHRALILFLAEGERQIKPADID